MKTVGITGGHSELKWDMIKLFQEIPLNVKVIGGMPDHKRTRLRNFDTCRQEHENIEQVILRYISEYGDDVRRMICGNPSLHEYCYKHGVGKDIEQIAKAVDVFYAYLPRYVAVYYRHKPTVWQWVGGENAKFVEAADTIEYYCGKVVCYSENQRVAAKKRFPVIHFYKDENEFCGWDGHELSVLYMANSLQSRKEVCHEKSFLETRIPEHWWLAGSNNESYGSRAIEYTYSGLKAQMRQSRLFFNLGTEPAPYTLGLIEAAMTGMPVVTYPYQHDSSLPQYQVPSLLKGGCITIDNPMDVNDLLLDKERCIQISQVARKQAVRHFGKQKVLKKWRKFVSRFF